MKKGIDTGVFLVPVLTFDSKAGSCTVHKHTTYAIIASNKLGAVLKLLKHPLYHTNCEKTNQKRFEFSGRPMGESSLDRHPYATDKGKMIA